MLCIKALFAAFGLIEAMAPAQWCRREVVQGFVEGEFGW